MYFFSMDQITQILLFSEMPLLERFKITVRERHILKKKITMKVLGLRLLYVKRYFQEQLLIAFLWLK